MCRSRLPRLACLWIALLLSTPLPAITLKIGTLAPIGSPWTDTLRRLAGELQILSGGQVELKVYAGGTVGEEADMIRKMRIGQLQGAALTQLGLGLLEPSVLALSVPFLIQTEEELEHVLEGFKPDLARLLEQKGFRLLVLAKGGWVHLFSTAPLVYPDDLKPRKLALPAEEQEFVDIWRRMGFNTRPLPISELLRGLQTGLAEAIYAPKLAAASFQWFGPAHHMSSLEVAPAIGGVVISSREFSKIPEGLQPLVLELFAFLERELNRLVERLEREALGAMQRHGLIVHSVPPEAVEQWKQLGKSGAEIAIGQSFPLVAYERVQELLEELRL